MRYDVRMKTSSPLVAAALCRLGVRCLDGPTLRRLRQDLGLSPQQLANYLGGLGTPEAARITVSRWERWRGRDDDPRDVVQPPAWLALALDDLRAENLNA